MGHELEEPPNAAAKREFWMLILQPTWSLAVLNISKPEVGSKNLISHCSGRPP
jgi:hypothetical protein